MLKYLAVSGVIISALFVGSEIGVNLLGNMLKKKRETGVPVKTQLQSILKNRQS